MCSTVFKIVILFHLQLMILSDNNENLSRIKRCRTDRYAVPITLDKETLTINFWLVTRKTIDEPKISQLTDAKLFGGVYKPQLPTILLIHGFNESSQTSSFANKTTKEYLSAYDGEVIITYWDAALENYTEARSAVRTVALGVALFIDRMVNEESLNLKSLTVIGSGMGAHIGGVAGRLILGKVPIGRMIGLDAANPLFIPGGEDAINTKSASFVQLIQTSVTAEGILQPLGHANFYPNGGFPPQPGCEKLTDFRWTVCSHQRAYELYIETFKNPSAFPAMNCKSYEGFLNGECDDNSKAYMGHHASQSARGKFYLQTRSSSPYGKGDSKSSKGDKKNQQKSKAKNKESKNEHASAETMKSSEENRVHFYLFTRDNPEKPVISNVNSSNIFDGAYDGSKPTVVLIPGYLNAPQNSSFVDVLVRTHLSTFDVSVIAIFWDVALDDYRISSSKTKDVAIVVAQFVDRMVSEQNLNLGTTTVIGHSSGAQIAGTAGRLVNGKVSRMVGLDPAGPLFSPGGYNVINENSAEFVQVIHVAGTVLGIYEPLGHVDFYVNGGLPPQPGCESIDNILPISPFCASCSHLERAIELYAESITKPHAFPATCLPKDNLKGICSGKILVFMGSSTSTSARGHYQVITRTSSPYGLG